MGSTHFAIKKTIKHCDEKALKRSQEMSGVGPHSELAYVIQRCFDHEEHVSNA